MGSLEMKIVSNRNTLFVKLIKTMCLLNLQQVTSHWVLLNNYMHTTIQHMYIYTKRVLRDFKTNYNIHFVESYLLSPNYPLNYPHNYEQGLIFYYQFDT